MNAMNQKGNNEYRVVVVVQCRATKGTCFMFICLCVFVSLCQYGSRYVVPYFIQLLILYDQTRCAQLLCQNTEPNDKIRQNKSKMKDRHVCVLNNSQNQTVFSLF